jgi:chromosomal replication initiation ATPase DnaA
MTQKFFNYKFSEYKDEDNFYVNDTNLECFNVIINPLFDQNIFLFGPIKSGKSHLANIWKEKNDAIFYNDNFDQIIQIKKNLVIDDIFQVLSEESIFHLINHCKLFNLKILVTSSVQLNKNNFMLQDVYSRLRSFYHTIIYNPDDDMCKIIMTKLFHEKQIIIKNIEIFDYILNRVSRTYEDIFSLVQKLDKLSLEKKRELTIPLIREIL